MAAYQTMIGGHKMPSLGLGTWNATTEEEMEQALDTALELGYRHIDTAYLYQNEYAIGRVLKKWLDSGKIKREELFVTTKLPTFGIYPDKVQYYIGQSLERLQLDYVDLYLIHQPFATSTKEDGTKVFDVTDHLGVWKKMEELVDQGKTKTIGISNFNIKQTARILENSRIKPACNQIELSPFLQQRELVEFLQKNGIVVVGYSVFGSPGREKPGLGGRAVSIPLPDILGDATIKRIAENHKKSPGQVVLRFFVQKNVVMIPKSVSPIRLKANLDVFDFSLSKDEIKAIEGLERGEEARTMNIALTHPEVKGHPEYPYPVKSGEKYTGGRTGEKVEVTKIKI